MNLKKKLFLNSLSGIGQLAVNAILSLISIPLFIHKLGPELYGVFCLISIIGNLNLFANIGLNVSLLTFISKQGSGEESNKDIVVTFSLLMLIVIPLTYFAYSQDHYILIHLLGVPTHYYQIVIRFYHFLLAANAILLIGQIFVAVLDSKQKIYLSSLVQSIYSLIYWLGIITTLTLGYSLPEVGYSIFGAAFIWIVLLLIFTYKTWGLPKVELTKNEFLRIATKHISFGAKVSFAGFVNFFYEPLTKILISNFIGLQFVGFYDIALKLKMPMMGIFQKILYPLYPYFAERIIDKGLRKLLLNISLKIFLLCGIISLIVIFIGPLVLSKWLGAGSETTIVFSVVIIVASLLFSAPIIPVYSFFQVKLKPTNNIIIQVSSVLINVVAFFALLQLTSSMTVVLANLLASIGSFTLCLYLWRKFPGFPLEKEMHAIFRILLVFIIIGASCFLLDFVPVNIYIKKLTELFVIIVGAYLLIRQYRLISDSDIELYFRDIPFANRILTKIFISKSN